MPTLREIQEEQKPWTLHNFPNRKSHTPLLGAVEELGELARAYIKAETGIRGSEIEHMAKKKDAIGDIVLFLSDYCTAEGFDLQECVEETWAIVKQRDWKKYPLTGRPGKLNQFMFDYNSVTPLEEWARKQREEMLKVDGLGDDKPGPTGDRTEDPLGTP